MSDKYKFRRQTTLLAQGLFYHLITNVSIPIHSGNGMSTLLNST
jgi:hypothetical protein